MAKFAHAYSAALPFGPVPSLIAEGFWYRPGAVQNDLSFTYDLLLRTTARPPDWRRLGFENHARFEAVAQLWSRVLSAKLAVLDDGLGRTCSADFKFLFGHARNQIAFQISVSGYFSNQCFSGLARHMDALFRLGTGQESAQGSLRKFSAGSPAAGGSGAGVGGGVLTTTPQVVDSAGQLLEEASMNLVGRNVERLYLDLTDPTETTAIGTAKGALKSARTEGSVTSEQAALIVGDLKKQLLGGKPPLPEPPVDKNKKRYILFLQGVHLLPKAGAKISTFLSKNLLLEIRRSVSFPPCLPSSFLPPLSSLSA